MSFCDSVKMRHKNDLQIVLREELLHIDLQLILPFSRASPKDSQAHNNRVSFHTLCNTVISVQDRYLISIFTRRADISMNGLSRSSHRMSFVRLL